VVVVVVMTTTMTTVMINPIYIYTCIEDAALRGGGTMEVGKKERK